MSVRGADTPGYPHDGGARPQGTRRKANRTTANYPSPNQRVFPNQPDGVPFIPARGTTRNVSNGDIHADPASSGKIGWVALWLLGIPLPILLLVYFLAA